MTEEETIVDYILDLDWRGFPLRLTAVKDLADSLLAARNREPVSQSWAKTSVKRWPKLSTKFNRKYDYKRVNRYIRLLASTSKVLKNWLVRCQALP